MIRVLIADDHAVVREGLKQIIADNSDMTIKDEASNAFDTLEKVRRGGYDVIILDISMPGRSGLDVLLEVRKHHPKLPVLVLSMHPEDQFAVRALKAGASGYLTKESAPGELVQAIRKVCAGGTYVSAALAEKLAFDLVKPTDKQPHETLSDREYQIFLMIASGMTSSEIARELALSIKTVSTYRSRIADKMHLKSTAELTRYAIEHALTK